MSPGEYWTYFNRVAGRAGVSAAEMARALASISEGSSEARAAVNGLRTVLNNRIVTGELAGAIGEAVTYTEALSAGTGVTAAGVETATIAAEATVATSESGGLFSAIRAVAGGIATWIIYATVVLGASYLIAQKVGRVQCHVVVVNGQRSGCDCINDSFIPDFILSSMKAEACGALYRR